MDLGLGAVEREGERRAAALLDGEGRAFASLPRRDTAGQRALLLSAQRALLGDLSTGPAARLAVARASAPLFLALESTRHFREVAGAAAGGALGEREAAALLAGDRIGAVAFADAAEAARLRREGEGWRLTAGKSFVTNGPVADWIAVFAEADGRQAVCLVSAGDEGVGPREPMELMGLDGLPVSSLAVEGAFLPAARVLGPFEDRSPGSRYRREADLSLALAGAGLMRRVLRAANRHAHAHRRDGRPVFSRQEVAFRLAEMASLAEAAELLCHRAAWMVESGARQADTVVRCAKVFCAESAERVASAGLQVMGGEGYRRGGPAEQAYRDAKGLCLAGTTLEVARMEIADALLSR